MSAYSNSVRDYIERFQREVRPGEGLIDPHEVDSDCAQLQQ